MFMFLVVPHELTDSYIFYMLVVFGTALTLYILAHIIVAFLWEPYMKWKMRIWEWVDQKNKEAEENEMDIW